MDGKVRFSKGLGRKICDRIAMGESLRAICAEPGMPARGVVSNWLFDERRVGFQAAYGKARQAQAEILADELIEIADAAGDREAMMMAKVRIDVRRWMIERWRADGGAGASALSHEEALRALGADKEPADEPA